MHICLYEQYTFCRVGKGGHNNSGFHHTPVISFLQISGQLTFRKNLSEWGLGASIRFHQGKEKVLKPHCHSVNIIRSYTVLSLTSFCTTELMKLHRSSETEQRCGLWSVRISLSVMVVISSWTDSISLASLVRYWQRRSSC